MSSRNKGKVIVNPLGIIRPVPGAGVGLNNSRKKLSPKKPVPKRRTTRRRARNPRIMYE